MANYESSSNVVESLPDDFYNYERKHLLSTNQYPWQAPYDGARFLKHRSQKQLVFLFQQGLLICYHCKLA
jgi:hypothetical protein